MNYAHFKTWLQENENELVERFGVPRDVASQCMQYTEVMSIPAECEARERGQFVLAYKQHGPSRLSEATGLSRQTLRKRFNKAISRKLETKASA